MKILDIQNDLPKQIELVICDEFDEGQEAYMYITTCKKTNKWYLGIHMDKDKYYWKSATDEEFRKLFSNKESKFEYKLLESGTYSYMKDREYIELTKVDARNNPMSWNKSNGIPNSKNMIDEDLINEIHSKIKNNEYKKITLTKAKVKPIDFYQSRIQEVDWSRVQEIKSQIQSKAGSTHVCDPLILFDGTTISDDYFGIDGKHTSQGFLGAEDATVIDAFLLPRDLYIKMSESTLFALGSSFNPNLEKKKVPTSIDDQAPKLIEWHFGGTELWNEKTNRWNKHIRSYLVNLCGFSPKMLSNLKTKISNELKKEDMKLRGNLMFKSYEEDGPNYHEVEKKVKELEGDGIHVDCGKGSSLTLDRLVSKVKDPNTTNVIYVTYHTNPLGEEQFKSIKKRVERAWNWFGNSDKHLRIVEMNSWIPRISKGKK